MRKAVLEFIDHAETVFKQAVGLEPEPTTEPDIEPEVDPAVTEAQPKPAEADDAVKKETVEVEAPEQSTPNIDRERTATPQGPTEHVNGDQPSPAGLSTPLPADPSPVNEDADMQDAPPTTVANEQGIEEEHKEEQQLGNDDNAGIGFSTRYVGNEWFDAMKGCSTSFSGGDFFDSLG